MAGSQQPALFKFKLFIFKTCFVIPCLTQNLEKLDSRFPIKSRTSFAEFNPTTNACLRADTHRQKNLC